MTLSIYKTVRKKFPVKVLQFRWVGIVQGDLQELRCSACSHKIGDKEFGIAWVEDCGIERPLRLCIECSKDAINDFEYNKSTKE